MADIIQVRRDTAANWAGVDPVLADGEWGYEQDTGKLKLGNGVDEWTALGYLLGDADAIHDNISGEINALADVTPATGDVLVIEDASDTYKKKKIQIEDFAAAGHDHDADYLPASIGGVPTAGHVPKLAAVGMPPPNWSLVDSGYDIGDFSMDGHTHSEADITDLDHTDDAAIHDNVVGEISAITEKTTPVSNDVLLLEDSEASYAKKKVLVSKFSLAGHGHSGGVDTTAIHDNVASEISAVTEKEALVNGDMLLIEDSEATNAKKRARLEKVWEMAPAKGGADSDAIHYNVANEIDKLTAVAYDDTDVLLIEDTSDSKNKKKLSVGALAAAGHTHTYYDANAVHDNEANEFSALTNKATPAANDVLIIEDSAASYAKKKLLISALPGGGAGSDTTAIHDNVAGEISALTKVSPASGDLLLIEDSSDTFNKKSVDVSDFSLAGHTHTYYDSAAFHDNETGEINALTPAAPVAGDYLLMEDASASFAKRKLDIDELALAGHAHGGGIDPTAIHDNTANEISAITEKTTPANDDILVIEDSAASYVKKKLKISNLPGGSGLTQAQVLARGLGA